MPRGSKQPGKPGNPGAEQKKPLLATDSSDPVAYGSDSNAGNINSTPSNNSSSAASRALNTGGFVPIAGEDRATDFPHSVEYVEGDAQPFRVAPPSATHAGGAGAGSSSLAAAATEPVSMSALSSGGKPGDHGLGGEHSVLLEDGEDSSGMGPQMQYADAAAHGATEPGAGSWEARLQYMKYYLAIAMWLPKYNWRDRLLGDMVAGLSIGAMLIPQVRPRDHVICDKHSASMRYP